MHSHVHGVAFLGNHLIGQIISYRKAGRSDQYRSVTLADRGYTLEQAERVIAWINGYDQPLKWGDK